MRPRWGAKHSDGEISELPVNSAMSGMAGNGQYSAKMLSLLRGGIRRPLAEANFVRDYGTTFSLSRRGRAFLVNGQRAVFTKRGRSSAGDWMPEKQSPISGCRR